MILSEKSCRRGRSSDNDKLSLADVHMDIEDRIFKCPQGAPAIFSSENEDGSIEVLFGCERCKECPVGRNSKTAEGLFSA